MSASLPGLQTLRQILFLVSAPLFFITFAIPVQAKQLGASAVEIGALFSLFTISLMILRPMVGFALDHWGRKPFVVVAMAIYCIANIFYAFATDLSAMYAARILQGIGASLMLISVDTITADFTQENERAVAMGRNIETQTRSSIVGATIGFTLLGAMPLVAWKYTFGVYAVMSLAAMFVAFIRLPESLPKNPETYPGSWEVTPGIRRLLVVIFFTGFASALMQPIYLIYLQDKFDLPLQVLAWAFLPSAIIYAVLPSKLGKLGDRFGNVKVLAFGLSMVGIVYLCLPKLQYYVGFIIVYTVSSVGWAMFEPAKKSLISMQASELNRGRVFGIAELSAGIGASAGPIVGGYIYDQSGASLTFYLTGMLMLGTAVLAMLLLSSKKIEA
jgi:MFS transporter, DHA1 family, multidrug resistance protein